ncbi:MAG: T9SS type A sorting domain-containing protein, partial [Flavobacteriales bacterium]|nr:T9SS type A sorting domain-containing protein [Flavobacteriales bacterium]
SVYPNPTDGIVRIRRAGEAADVRVELLDVSGRLVLVERLHLASGAEHTMDLRGLVPAGSYVLRLNA